MNGPLEHCGCLRHLKGVKSNPPDITYNQTTCSYDAYRRGPNQKIVGFSFYGSPDSDRTKNKGYFKGIVGNLELMPKYYPGWTMRLYYDLEKKDPILKDLCDLACRDTNIDICDTKHLPGTPFVSELFLKTRTSLGTPKTFLSHFKTSPNCKQPLVLKHIIQINHF